MSYTLRPCTDADWPLWQRFHKQGYHDRVVGLWGQWDDTLQEGFARKEFFETQHAGQFVIVQGGKDIGYLSYNVTDAELYLQNFVLDESVRGQGLGESILRHLQQFAVRTKRTMRLQTFTNNPARKLYEKVGFVNQGENDIKHYVMTWKPE